MTIFIITIVFVFPLMFQIIFGRKAIAGSTNFSFLQITLLSIAAQFISLVINFMIMANNLESKGITCGLPLAGVIMITMFFSILLLIAIIIQYHIKKYFED